MTRSHGIEFGAEDIFHHFGTRTVDGHLHAEHDEGILDFFDAAFQSQQAIATSGFGEADDFLLLVRESNQVL